MATEQLNGVIQHIRSAMSLCDVAGLTDRQLLGDFVSRRDETALAALMQRHGPMVWGVCRRVLGSHHDAEDAFQATFLVLVRRAASIASRELIANWLYGVAHRTAMKARSINARRQSRERQVLRMPDPAVVEQDRWDDLQPLLDQELSRLPDMFRVVIVLCDLEGKTRKEAARYLHLPEGTVGSRLARAREVLAKRLTDRGLALTGGALAMVLAQNAAAAGMPDSVMANTIGAASLLAAGQSAAEAVSPPVAALTDGVLKAMLMSKLKTTAVLVLGFLVTGATILALRAAAAEGEPLAAAEERAALPRNDGASTANGKRNPGDPDAIDGTWVIESFVLAGEAVPDEVLKRLKATPLKVKEGKFTTPEGVDVVFDATRKPHEVAGTHPDFDGYHGIYRIDGDRLTVCRTSRDNPRPTSFSSTKENGWQLRVYKRSRTLPVEQKEKEVQKMEAFTAWGKEIGGLQAGLGYQPGQKRAYSHGETVKIVLRVRNVTQEAIAFKHIWAFFVENPPTITDADGRLVQLPRYQAEGLQRPRSNNVAPGAVVDIYDWEIELRPKEETSKRGLVIHGTGKFSIQCERIVGPTSGNPDHPNPALDKLATGKLELEVNVEPPKPEEEILTAWGKEVGGLQAGLGLKAGAKRVYQLGEIVTLVVRVRNVGKEPLKFQYIRQFLDENPPVVTDADGKTIPQSRTSVLGFHSPMEVSLEPGKETELESRLAGGPTLPGASGLRFELRPASGGGNPTSKAHPLFVGTGKVSLQYERVVGNSSSGRMKLDPTLSKLATGKLELEIQSDPPPAATEKKPSPEEAASNPNLHLRVPEEELRVWDPVNPNVNPVPFRVYGPKGADGVRKDQFRHEAIGKRVRVEAIAWGYDVETEGPKSRVVFEGGIVLVKGVDFNKPEIRGRCISVVGTLRLGQMPHRGSERMLPNYYFIDAESFRVIDKVSEPNVILEPKEK
jgi:RNA polymerase sigma factor (sigma-70 family)